MCMISTIDSWQLTTFPMGYFVGISTTNRQYIQILHKKFEL